jgi:thiol:disulfide interchange protein
MMAMLALAAIVFAASVAQAQLELRPPGSGGLADLGSGKSEPVVKTSGYFTAPASDKPGMLFISAEVAPGWHIYSITQSPGGPLRTKLKISDSPNYKLAGEFKALQPAVVHHYDDIYPKLPVEEHQGRVTWAAPIDFPKTADLNKLEIAGAVNAQACKTDCLLPEDYKFVAKLGTIKPADAEALEKLLKSTQVATGDAAKPADAKSTVPNESKSGAPPVTGTSPTQTAPGVARYKSSMSQITLSGKVEPATVSPGSIAKLVITAEPDKDWHVYALAEKDPVDGSKPTLIVLTQTGGFRFRTPQSSRAPLETPTTSNQSGKSLTYDRPVSWTIELAVPKEAKPGNYSITGVIGYQSCNATTCLPPIAAWFDGAVMVGTGTTGTTATSTASPLLFRDGKYSEASKLADQAAGQAAPPTGGSVGPSTMNNAPPSTSQTSDPPPDANLAQSATHIAIPADDTPFPQLKIREFNSGVNQSFVIVLVLALAGGFILNFMPCVLPVIGLKLLSFVEQSHHNRRHVLALNLWYSAGLMSVFMVLAVLASAASLGLGKDNLAWGEQFNSAAFNIVMCGLVFAMALSFLGVWEIPIPGLVGSGKTAELATQEGAAGAFTKGVLSTVLATPCSGPLLGTVFGFTLKQPPEITFAVFGCIGLGMASPYLVIGAFPKLIRFLPKPGAWMDTFKHIMGFVMLGTVVYLFTFLGSKFVVPTFGMLVGIWAGCWWIGRVSLTAEIGTKMRAWIGGTAAAAAVVFVSFTLLVESKGVLAWEPFSPQLLAKARGDGKTVLVDFTAVWCPTCQTNLKFAIDTEDVRKLTDRNGVVTLKADFSDVENSPDIKRMLAILESKSIPLLAIYPAEHPDEVIVLRDLVSKNQVIDALQTAGPSRTNAALKETAMK